MSENLITLEDAIEHVLDVFVGDREQRAFRLARNACFEAYRQVPIRHRWSYYERRGQIHTVASDSGTCSFDFTGGASERLVTVSGLTFPDVADIHLYKLQIEDNVYDIQDRLSSTTAQLTVNTNPGQDIAAGTSCTLFKSKYELIDGFRRMASELVDLPRGWSLPYISPSSMLRTQVGQYQPQQELEFTIHTGGEYYGASLVELAPPPNRARTYDYVCEVGARPFSLRRDVVDGHKGETVTCDGTTTIEGTNTNFTSRMVGCILRVAEQDHVPPSGLRFGLANRRFPYDVQRTIMSVESTTSLTVDASISTRSNVGYTISDPIDIDPQIMTEYFLRECEARMARLMQDKNAPYYRQEAERELIAAQVGDNRKRDIETKTDRSAWGLAEWAIPSATSGMSPLT